MLKTDELIGEQAYRQLAATGYQEWLDKLPKLVEKATRGFGVEVLGLLEGGSASCGLKVAREDAPLVLKIQPGNTLFYQAIAYGALEEREVAPKLIAHNHSWGALLMSYIEGEPIAELGIQEVVELHKKLQVTPQGLPALNVITQKWLKTARKVQGLPRDYRRLLSLMPIMIDMYLLRQEHSLLHTDFKPEHIIRTPEGLKVLDIDGGWGNPAYDLGSMGLLMGDPLEALSRIEKLASLSGTGSQEMAAWGAFRAAISGIFAYGRGDEEKALLMLESAIPLLSYAEVF